MLGKGIVLANDVPGFIGNRVGIYSLLQTARVMEEMWLSADVADALTGPILGRPKSATLRTADTVGLDVLALISQDLTRVTSNPTVSAVRRVALLGRPRMGPVSASATSADSPISSMTRAVWRSE